MQVTSDRVGEIRVVKLSGRFDAKSVSSFKEVISSQGAEATRYVMDFAEVAYIDSTALGFLVSLLKKVREAGGDVKLASLSEKVRSVFELTRLNQVFDLYDDPQTAQSSFV